MIAPPPNLRTDDQIIGYFKQAQEAIGDDIPWVLQDYPLTLTVVFTPAVIRKIVMDSPSCVMLKHEDWPGLEKISALRGFQKDGSLRPLSILTGNGGLFLDFEMERGADGAMTGYAFPELLIDVVKLSKAGKRDAAHDLFDAHLPLIRYEQQPGAGLAVRKYVLQKRGVIASSCAAQAGREHHAGGEGRSGLFAVAGRADRPARPSAAAIQRRRLRFSWEERVFAPTSNHLSTAPRDVRGVVSAETVAPRPASTILLLRDNAASKEIEVFMMVRHYEIDFNSGALVFPGGSVDKGDNEIIASPGPLFRRGRARRNRSELPDRRDPRDLRGKRHSAGAAERVEIAGRCGASPARSKPRIAPLCAKARPRFSACSPTMECCWRSICSCHTRTG